MRQGRNRRCGCRLSNMPETASRLLVAASIAFMAAGSMASQSPRRDCCGAYSRKNHQSTVPPENDAEPRKAILSCSEAHEMCIDDTDCRGALKSVLLLCGKETVACSTSQLNPCQMAVRALAGFSFYQPTCLCKEPHLDPECNVIRNFVFDHPCLPPQLPVERGTNQASVIQQEQGAELLTCLEAQKRCQNDPECRAHFEEFTLYCGFSWASCPREKCVTAWEKIRRFPVVGCTCRQDDTDAASCLSVHRLVNENPCLDALDRNDGTGKDGTMDEVLLSSIFSKLHGPAAGLTGNIGVQGRMSGTVPESSYNKTAPNELRATSDVVFRFWSSAGEDEDRDKHGIKGISLAPGSSTAMDADYGFSASCLESVEKCMDLRRCKETLEAQLRSCRKSDCDDDVCAGTTQSFFALMGDTSFREDYSGVLDPESKQHDGIQQPVRNVAFCSCRRGDSQCQSLLTNLAPVCVATQAQSSFERSGPKCHDLARSCKEDPSCRLTLTAYTQQCAIDPVTGRCLGETDKCIDATAELMKSPVFRACSCAGAQFVDALVCNDWKRLLWGNTCTEQSRRKYWEEEAKRRKSLSTSSSSHSSGISRSSVESHLQPHFRLSSSTGLTAAGAHYGDDGRPSSKEKGKHATAGASARDGNMHQSNHDGFHRVGQSDATSTTTASSVAKDENPVVPFGGGNDGKHASKNPSAASDGGFLLGLKDSRHPYISSVDGANNDIGGRSSSKGGQKKKPASTKGVAVLQGDGSNRRRRPVSVQHEEGYCVIEDIEGRSQTLYIAEGETTRVYDADRQEGCSELCNCTTEGSLSCRVLGCLKEDPCETNVARYAHMSKPLQPAYRRPCLCLHGTIVCARPPKNDNPVPKDGLFMFIGYNTKEETLLKEAGHVTIHDAIVLLQRMFEGLQVEQNKGDGEVYCTMVTFHRPKSGNVVLEIQTTKPLGSVPVHAQEMCSKHAKSIANMINNRDERIIRPPALSLLRLADVGPGTAATGSSRSSSRSELFSEGNDWNHGRSPSSSSASPVFLAKVSGSCAVYTVLYISFVVASSNVINGLLCGKQSCVRQERCSRQGPLVCASINCSSLTGASAPTVPLLVSRYGESPGGQSQGVHSSRGDRTR